MNTTSPTEATTRNPTANGTPPVTRTDDARVAAFISAHKLGDYVEAAIQLAREAFPNAKRITLSMFGEPGEYGERLSLDILTGVGVDETLHQRVDYLTRWIASTPPWVTDRMGISTYVS